jgi:hypothetical protein
MIYRALSVVAPAGDWIREGRKTLEVRRWMPEVLPLLDLVIVENATRLSATGVSRDPEGAAIAIVDVSHVTDWTNDQLDDACGSVWEEGWFAWHLTNLRRINPPVSAPAERRIYEIDLPDGLHERMGTPGGFSKGAR